jgi:hypothetical protein
VGEIETTSKSARYPDPRPGHGHIIYWDIPGGNTTSRPAATYFEDLYLYMFELLVICFAGRLTELDVEIAAKVGLY